MIGPVEREADKRVAELIGVSGIEIHVVVAVGEVTAFEGNLRRLIVPFERGLLPFGTPLGFGFVGRDASEADQRAFAGGLHAHGAAAQETGCGVEAVGAVEIVNAEAESAGAHEVVEVLIEEEAHVGAHLVGEVFPERAFAGVGIVGFAELREQQQARVVQSPGGEDDDAGRLLEFLAGGVGVGDAFGFSIAVHDAAHLSSGAQGEILLVFEEGQQRVGGLGLGADHASEAGAESAIGAAGARDAVGISISLAQGCGWQRIGVIAGLMSCLLEERRGVGCLVRRQRILVLARGFEDIAALDFLSAQIAGFAGDAEHLFGAPVVGFEFVVGDAPVLRAHVFGGLRAGVLLAQFGAEGEDFGSEAVGERAPVFARAAGPGAGLERSVLADGHGVRFGGVPVGQGFIGEILHHAEADGVVELVHAGGVLAVFAAGAAFQDDDRMRGARGDFFGHQEAGESAADDHHVDWLEALHIEMTMSHFGRIGYILRLP